MGNISSSHHYSVSVFVYNQQQIASYLRKICCSYKKEDKIPTALARFSKSKNHHKRLTCMVSKNTRTKYENINDIINT